jgi:predicted acylesterase/phospholipase RssA
MGGGVSLGTFCGTALTQAIKLALVYGRDRHQQPYDRVEIDVFSGASAGALSLCAMLRSLADCDPALEQAARQSVETEFGQALDRFSPERMNDLLAAQIAQFKQEELWSREIKLDALLGQDGQGQLRRRASLLDRGAVDDIARRHIVTWPGNQADFSRRRLLADRVVYACTLSNLTPIVVDASSSLPGREVGYVGLADGLRSHSHRDLRVFDLHFTKEQSPTDPAHPDRWCRYHNAPERSGKIGDLRKARSWAKIAATAIASGAFPGAFEPVVLRRNDYEFCPKLWQATFGEQAAKLKQFSFTYADGGMFNNEPIREAFRLASFIDGHNPDDGNHAVERLIVFVDPFVSEPTPRFNLPVHRQWSLEEPNVFGSMDGFDLRQRNSLDRLLPHLSTLLGAISNESRTIESDRISQVRDVFKLRSGIRDSLDRTLASNATVAEFERLKDFITRQLESSKADEMIPAGPLTLAREMERIIAEEAARERTIQPPPPPRFGPLKGKSGAFLQETDPTKNPDAGTWLRVLSFVSVDLILGLEGKEEGAKLVAIAPFRDLRAAEAGGKRPRKIDLPGGRLGGFAGFMSDIPDALEFRAARYCAAEFLRACEVLAPDTPLPPADGLTLLPEDWKRYHKEVEHGLDRLSDRVQQLLHDSHLINVFPGADALLRKLAGQIARKAVAGLDWEEHDRTTVELRIVVPNERFELDGRGAFGGVDAAPVEDEVTFEWRLITLATFDHTTGEWSGGFVKDGTLDVDEDGRSFLPDKDFCTVKLPTRPQVELARRHPTALMKLHLKAADRGKTLPARRWEIIDGVTPLNEELAP